MSKSDSVFTVASGYYHTIEGAYSSLDAVKNAVLSDMLIDALEGDKYLCNDDVVVTEWVDGEAVNHFEISCEGVDWGVSKVTNINKFIETLDLACVTRR